MMEKIRTAANSVIVKIIFGIIILAFIFTGVGGFLGFNSSSADDERLYIAKVDGEGISRAGFEEQVNQALEQAVLLGGENNDSLKPAIRNRVFLSNIDNHLNYKLAENLDLNISDDQVKNIIRQQSVFFVNGVFNNERYLTLLQQNGYTPDLYAELLRADAQKKQLLTGLLLTDFSLPVESTLSQLIGQKREGYYSRVNLNDIVDKSGIEVSEAEIQQYYQENQKKFMRSDRVKVKLLLNNYADIMKQVKTPTKQDIEKEYNANKSDYIQPAKYEVILVQAKNEDDAKKLDSSIKKQNGISHIGKTNLINLGWFSESNIPDYLMGNLLKKGQSKVIDIDGNYYVAFLNNIQDQKVLPFEYVQDKIKSTLFYNEVNEKYDQINTKLLRARSEDKTLEEIAAEAGLEIFEPEDWQTKNDYYSIAINKELQNILFSEEMVQNGIATQNISDLIEITDPKSTYIIQVLDYRPEGIAPYEEIYDKAKETLVQTRSQHVFSEALDKLVLELNAGKSDGRIKFITKYQVQRDLSEENDLSDSNIDMIYSLIPPVANKIVYGYDFDKYNSAIVAVLTKVKDSEYQDISAELINISKNITYSNLNSYLRSKAKIEMMPDANL